MTDAQIERGLKLLERLVVALEKIVTERPADKSVFEHIFGK